jgi:hypothetical protein
VRMYVCGITVYDYCHVGHARFLVVLRHRCSAGCGTWATTSPTSAISRISTTRSSGARRRTASRSRR